MTARLSFRCLSCNKSFSSDAELFDHIYDYCRSYCFYCGPGKSIPDGKLIDHFQRFHSKFECPECEEVFFLRSNWNEHMLTHVDLSEAEDEFVLHLSDVMARGEKMENVAKRLTPSKAFFDTCDEILGRVQKFMDNNTSYKNGQVFMAGSVGKRTALEDMADIDLMYYRSGCSLDELMKTNYDMIERLKGHVQNGDMNWASDLIFQGKTPFSLQFILGINSNPPIPVDLLPVVDVLKVNYKSERERLYKQMKTMDKEKQDVCQRCLSKVQVSFVKNVPKGLKDVIRIMKAWSKKIKKDERCSTFRSYFCELVVINSWTQKGKANVIDIDYYVKLAFYDLCFCETIRIIWPGQYQHHIFTNEIDGPMVLDPANPFCNVAPKIQHAAIISRRARELMRNDKIYNIPDSFVIEMDEEQTEPLIGLTSVNDKQTRADTYAQTRGGDTCRNFLYKYWKILLAIFVILTICLSVLAVFTS